MMTDRDRETISELAEAYHKLGLAVRELSVKQDTQGQQLDGLEQMLFRGSVSLQSRVAILETRLAEQTRLCQETRGNRTAHSSARIGGRATVTAAWIGGIITFLVAILSLIVAFKS